MNTPEEGARSRTSEVQDPQDGYQEILSSFGEEEVNAAVQLRCEQLEDACKLNAT